MDLERTYSTAKEEMDNRPEKDNVPDGQMNIDDVHEGVEYSVDQDGSVSLTENESEYESE